MLYRVTISTLLAALTLSAASQDEVASKLRRSMELVYAKPSARPPATPWPGELGAEYGLDLLPHLCPYMEADNLKVQFQVVTAIGGILSTCRELKERQQVVDGLTQWFCNPKCLAQPYIEELLSKVRSEDFSESARTALFEELREAQADAKRHPGALNTCILVVGTADVREALPVLADGAYKSSDDVETILATRTGWRSSCAWAALRARARMGVEEDIELCLRFARAFPDRDEHARFLSKDLAYVRQPQVVEYIRPFLFSDHLEDVGGSIDVTPQSEGQWAATALGQMLEGFPWTRDFSPGESALEECRAWMKGRTEYSLIR